MGHVDGTIALPPKTITNDNEITCNPVYTEWVKKDQFVISCLKLALLHDKLQSLSKGTMSIEEYLTKIKSIYDNLPTINHSISDSELVTCTLNGLPNIIEYQPVAFAIENRNNPISFNDLKARLLVHE
ncbi:uncharacterized protein LOC111278399 [Durio zibethinus]|uniref:Uncharacterized protein LOC111278399 n=1 Tax=Durio zibethinus TaxID=66656 RepID=A0A6P5WXB6_DURZI|nr:uncharacterized protein LOC111278399 [Durio zibethinus]